MDSKVLFEKVDKFRKDKGWTGSYLCKQAGVSHNTFCRWKSKGTMPTVGVLEAFCDVMQIPFPQLFVDEIIGDLPPEQKELIDVWATLSKGNRDALMKLMRDLRGQ